MIDLTVEEIRKLDYLQLKEYLFKKFEVSGEKAEKAYLMAHEDGHPSGQLEVMVYFERLVDLIK